MIRPRSTTQASIDLPIRLLVSLRRNILKYNIPHKLQIERIRYDSVDSVLIDMIFGMRNSNAKSTEIITPIIPNALCLLSASRSAVFHAEAEASA